MLVFFLTVFVGGALLSPWLHWLLQWAAHEVPLLRRLAREPFEHVVTRSMLVVAVAGLWPFLRRIGVRSREDVGFVHPSGQWRRLGLGFVLGAGSILCAALLALTGGARQFDGSLSASWWAKLPGITWAAMVISVVEELLFRGALFGALRRAHGWKTALFGSSAIYSILHFFQKLEPTETVTWLSGLALLPKMMSGFIQPHLMLPGFLALTLVGLLLGLAFQRTRNLWFSIGLHAGWIFWIKFNTLVTNARSGAAAWFWGSSKLFDGWPGVIVLAATAFVVWKMPQQKSINHDAP